MKDTSNVHNVSNAMIDLSYPEILSNFQEHLDPKRSESASFLIWYFENFLRLDPLEAVDIVCDQKGDKGVDGIYVNEAANTVEIYQTKISQKEVATIGDTLLKEFAGTLSQFRDQESIQALVDSAGSAEIGRLIKQMELVRRFAEFEFKGIFVSNIELDQNGQAFLEITPNIKFVGRSHLQSTYVSPGRNLPIVDEANFDVSGFETAQYVVDGDHEAIIAPVKASELVVLNGISNQTLFAYNVRGSLGRTQVNKDISQSIRDPSKHKLFPLFHNGITVIAGGVERTQDRITVRDYFVVNGCQSLTALYDNQQYVGGDLRILTKIVRASPASGLAEMVTRFSNNQNGVKARDFKSNNRIQIRLQNEMRDNYGNEYYYEIKRGESTDDKKVISNEAAGLYIMAIDLKIPWGTHRKYQVFEDLHAELFGRPSVTADRIVLYHLLYELAGSAVQKLKNGLVAKYVLTRYLLMYIVSIIIRKDDLGRLIFEDPEPFVRNVGNRAALLGAVDAVLGEIITDLNSELDLLPTDFDYRGKLRDEAWANKMAHEILSTHEKLVSRGRLDSFGVVYTNGLTTN